MKQSLKFPGIILGCLILLTSCDEKELDKTPVADFSIQIEGFKVQFVNLSENGTSYQWDFGDDSQSTEKDPEHVYASSGKFNVTLQVTNAKGTDEISKEIDVEELFQGDRILIGRSL